MALADLLTGSSIRTNVAFGIAAACCFLGFLVAIAMYVYYGFCLQKEMAAGNQALTYVFVGQGFGGMVAALFNKSAGT
jgi:hypothetical protein